MIFRSSLAQIDNGFQPLLGFILAFGFPDGPQLGSQRIEVAEQSVSRRWLSRSCLSPERSSGLVITSHSDFLSNLTSASRLL